MIRIGMGQMTVSGGEVDKNLAQATQFITAAAQHECDLSSYPNAWIRVGHIRALSIRLNLSPV